ncbi:MAG: PKD domain-containing protein [Bacteroidetes bacterium]|nr:PKD domain-containing protein [Bacteroidota bacterium]
MFTGIQLAKRSGTKALLPLITLLAFWNNGPAYSQCSANANFTFTFQQCATVQFVDQSSAAPNYTIVQWSWDFGDGNTSTIQNPVHTFNPGATYIVSLTVTADSSGVTCTDQTSRTVTAPDEPNVYFTWNPEPSCLGEPTFFYGTAGNPIVSWYWDFDDGQFSTLQNPVHLYPLTGTFDVSLSVVDNKGCTDTIIQQVTVADIPDVTITATPNPTCLNEMTNFTGSSSASVTSWQWNFGDGGSASGQTVNHTYLQTGTFNVTLSVVDINGCTNVETTQVTVNPLPSPNFIHTGPACLNDSVVFTDLSTSPNGYIVRWHWDFGDGNSTTINFPQSPNVSHLYANQGTFQVTLTVTDSDSCQNSTSRQVIVVANPIANFNNSIGCDGTPVNFYDLSSPNGGTNIISWYWEFDDPASGIFNTSQLQNPTHIFTTSGIFDVILIVENSNGCSDTIVKPVNINELPDVSIGTDSDTSCVNQPMQFYGNGTNIISWYWEFGDGGTSVQQNPVHVYFTPGTFVVTLTATDNKGCSKDTTRIIFVNEQPNASFTYSSPTCTGFGIDFYNLSTTPTGYINTWHWYFGDGTDTLILFPDNPDVSHIYDIAGSYVVSLAVTNSTGCIDSTVSEVIVGQGPEANFTHTGSPCEDNLVQFIDQSNGFGYNIQAWYWNFGDPTSGANNTSTLQNPYHIYNYPGTYTVSLQVTSSNGCIDTISQSIVIHPSPNVAFLSSPTIKCYGDTVFFNVDPDSTDIGAVAEYFWDFGDPASGTADTSSLPNPWHIFTASGTFYVTITIIDTIGCDQTYGLNVLINDIPDANYIFQQNCAEDSTLFIDRSIAGSAPITQWFWNFGDPGTAPNDTSNLQNPYHTFSGPGSYFVYFNVTDNNGCNDEVSKWVTIFDNPKSVFSYDQSCNPPGTIYFSDESVSGGSGSPIQSWLWELDNGYFSTEVNPVYTYSLTDTCYLVSLTITDENLCTNTITDTVCVFENLQVDFSFNDVCFRQRTVFTPSFTPDNDSVVAWTWNFGDGTPVINTPFDTMSHMFTAPGKYLVVLNAKDIHNCVSSVTHQVTVDSLPIPRFIADTASCNSATRFFDQSIGGGVFVTSWSWDFGDPSSGASNYAFIPNPTHLYAPIDSIYYVKLIVTNALGCTDSIIQPVIKAPCLTAGFYYTKYPLCTEDPICFTDTSHFYGNSGGLTQWEWDFGDGNTSIYSQYQDSICHEYTDPGTYTVRLVITAMTQGSSFSDTAFRTVQVRQAPTANFTFVAPCINHTTVFTNTTNTNGIPVTDWLWEFKDPGSFTDTSTMKNASYEYPSIGIYYPQLTATNIQGCKNTFIDTIEIVNPPRATFDFSNACMGNPVFFTDESDTSGGAIAHWFWNFGNPLSYSDTSILQNPSYTYDTSGVYLTRLIITDILGCMDTTTRNIEVYNNPKADFGIITNYRGEQGQIFCVNYSEGAITYEWDFDNGMTSDDTEPVVAYEDDGVFNIMLVAFNEYDCPDTTYLKYEFIFKGLYIPNAFAPTSDLPEVRKFEPTGHNLKTYQIEIFSMKGNLIWSSSSITTSGAPKESWNGTFLDEPAPPGTYIWKARATFKDNTTWQGMDDGTGNFRRSGTVFLIR